MTDAAVWERPEVWYDVQGGARGCACEVVGVIVTTEFAVGHSSLINGSEGSAHAGHGATSVDCVGLGASVAVGDSSFAARPGTEPRACGAGPAPSPVRN